MGEKRKCTEEKALRIFTIDSFSSVPFAGNPAAVCLDDTSSGLPDSLMQKIAAEMNISETAFIRKLTSEATFEKDSLFGLRWFTPTNEVPLCGHATLASAAVLLNVLGNSNEEVQFETKSGILKAKKSGSKIALDLPQNPAEPIEVAVITVSDRVKQIKVSAKQIWPPWSRLPQQEVAIILETIRDRAKWTKDRKKVEHLIKEVVGDMEVQDIQLTPGGFPGLLIRLADKYSKKDITELSPDIDRFMAVENSGLVKGVILTLKGSKENGSVDTCGEVYDCVSRYFGPWNGIPEDPVCGAAHTVLAPYWSQELGKSQLFAYQCSKRGGEMWLGMREDGRVDVAGHAKVVLEGSFKYE